jgi:integrase
MDAQPQPITFDPIKEQGRFPRKLQADRSGITLMDRGPYPKGRHKGRRYAVRVWMRDGKNPWAAFDEEPEARLWSVLVSWQGDPDTRLVDAFLSEVQGGKVAFKGRTATPAALLTAWKQDRERDVQDAFNLVRKRMGACGSLPLAVARDEYLAHLKGQRLSPRHIASARESIALLEKGLPEKDEKGLPNLDLAEATAGQEVLEYLNRLDEKLKWAPATKRRHFAVLKAMGKVVMANHDELVRVPLASLPSVKLPKTMPETFTPVDVRALLSDEAINHESGVGLLVALSLYTGLRAREAAWLRWEHVDFASASPTIAVKLPDDQDEGELSALIGMQYRFNGALGPVPVVSPITKKQLARIRKEVKGNKERKVRLFRELADLLAPIAKVGTCDYIFSREVRSWSSVQLGRRLRALCKDLGIHWRDGLKWHSLRATHASLMLGMKIMDVETLRQNLGHSTAAMSLHYAQSAPAFSSEAPVEVHLRQPAKAPIRMPKRRAAKVV